MARIFFCLLLYIFCGLCNILSAQIISVAPGTEFNIMAGTKLLADRVEFNFSGDFTFTNNTLYVDLVPNKIKDILTLQRIYRFTNTVNYMPVRLKINYLESELNGIGESELKFLYNNGKGWVDDNNNELNTIINILEGGPLNYTKIDAFTAGKYLVTDELIVVKAYPNPSATEFNVMVLAKGQEEIDITCMDMRGAIIETVKTRPYQNVRLGRNFINGTYMIRAVQGKKPIAAIRVVKL